MCYWVNEAEISNVYFYKEMRDSFEEDKCEINSKFN